jgi:putative transposase
MRSQRDRMKGERPARDAAKIARHFSGGMSATRMHSPVGTADMAHTYICNLVHVVFSTKERQKLISDGVRDRLWKYIGGIARTNGFKAIAIGGMTDHLHALLSLPATLPISKAVQLIKGGSSKWMGDNGTKFAWQEGYAAFSVSSSQMQHTIKYSNSQEKHHAKERLRPRAAASTGETRNCVR